MVFYLFVRFLIEILEMLEILIFLKILRKFIKNIVSSHRIEAVVPFEGVA